MDNLDWLDKLIEQLKELETTDYGQACNINPHMSSNSDWDYDMDYGLPSSWDGEYKASSKRKHEFSPVLLVFTTVYNCIHCKRKKEDCKYTYCEHEDNPPEYDIGGWG